MTFLRYLLTTTIPVILISTAISWYKHSCNDFLIKREANKIYNHEINKGDESTFNRVYHLKGNAIYYKVDTNLDSNSNVLTPNQITQRAFDKGVITEDGKKEYLLRILEIALKKKKQCKISSELQAKVAYNIYENAAGAACSHDAYEQQAEQQFIEMSQKDNYKEKELEIYGALMGGAVSFEHRENIGKYWSDKDFRKKLMIAMLNSDIRRENNCSNPMLPIFNYAIEMIE